MKTTKKQIKDLKEGLEICQSAIDEVINGLSGDEPSVMLKGVGELMKESRKEVVRQGELILNNSGELDMIKFANELVKFQGCTTLSKLLVYVIEKGPKDD